jgi:hypothetical protein
MVAWGTLNPRTKTLIELLRTYSKAYLPARLPRSLPLRGNPAKYLGRLHAKTANVGVGGQNRADLLCGGSKWKAHSLMVTCIEELIAGVCKGSFCLLWAPIMCEQ